MCRVKYAIVGAIISFVLLAGCELSSKDDDNEELTQHEQQIAELNSAMEPFRDFQAAQAAGYTVAIPDTPLECMKHPTLGAMGFHYGKGELINDELSITEPEVLIFEPQADGSVEFVGVEYVVPFAVHAEDRSPPILFGREFTQSERFQVWKLHAWVGRENPTGMHVDWNPNVSCEHEDKWN